MSEELHWKRAGRNSWYAQGKSITDPAELEKLSALRPPDDFGTARVVGEALTVLAEREERGKPASAVPHILGLLELLTPEEQLDLAGRLPGKLSVEAMARIAEAARPAPAGVNGEH